MSTLNMFPMKNYGQFTVVAFLLTLLFSVSGYAQLITTNPPFPVIDDEITITFDATQGSGGLAGFTGDVYAHTGVITSESTGSSDWRYVVAGWGVNIPKAKLTRIAPDLYELTIPDVREYYGVPASEEILQLALVFRSGTAVGGSWREGKTAQGGDIFIDIYEPGVFVRFDSPSTSPYFPSFVEPNAEIDVEIVASASISAISKIELFVDNTLVTDVADTESLSYSLTVGASGRTDLMAVATETNGVTDTTRTYVVVKEQSPSAARPAGIEDGVNYHENGSTVTFSMFAPGKEFVHVIGDFTDWEVSNDFLMNRYEVREDSVHFWVTVENLTAGQEYRFQYLVDGEIRIADLFSEKILDPGLDRFISNTVYPDLIAYPQDKTEGVVTVMMPGRTPYVWQSTDYQRPNQSELIVYELLLRDFVEESTFDVLRDTLDYLDRLGINAIELMPVSNFDGNLSWGYNPNFHGALDKSYGTRESFKRFVDAAHSRGIAVILDVVYNHTQEKSPLVALYGPNLAENRFLGPGHEFNVFRHLNHNDPYIRYWLDRMNRYWIETYNIDGYRFDLTKGFATNFNSSNYGGYNSQRIGNLKRMADRMWEVDSNAYIILEHFTADSEERELAHYRTNEPEINGMMFWNNVTTPYQEISMGYQGSNSNISNTWYRTRNWTVPNLIAYLESHDEQWIMFKNLNYGNRSGDYDIRNLDIALERQQAVGALYFTVPGPRMMWQFGELGYGG
ncbi:MAG: hypothetical protein LAT57_12205, partial [Balneolales bacterium]|nr:hypothetical protein [Balneolales bacterium]